MATGRDERGDKGRGEVTALAVACTDQTDAQIEIQREIDGESALETLRRRGQNANGRRRLNLTIIVRPISHPDIDLNDRYPEIRISIHNTSSHYPTGLVAALLCVVNYCMFGCDVTLMMLTPL